MMCGNWLWAWLSVSALCVLGGVDARAAATSSAGTREAIVEAREALRVGDKPKLSALRQSLVAAGHPLAAWVDYWDLSQRLTSATVSEVEAFYERWPRTYVEDRLRNDWLLELGRRRDTAAFLRDWPRFKMRDDKEVTCYGLWAQLQTGQAGQGVQAASEMARDAWWAQRESDDGCHQLALALVSAKRLSAKDVWHKVRVATEMNRPKVAKAAAALLGAQEERAVALALDKPEKELNKKTPLNSDAARQARLLALMKWASSDPQSAAKRLQEPWARQWPASWAALGWAAVGKQSALKLMPEAAGAFQKAWALQQQATEPWGWSDDTLAWAVRAALRSELPSTERWAAVLQAIEAMSASEQKDPAWVYWKARALLARSAEGTATEASKGMARQLLQSIASPFTFYGKLAVEELGGRVALPSAPAPLTSPERQAAMEHPGLQRALQLLSLGLRSEGVREWNFSLRGLNDRELMAAAQMACERQVWDRCISASDRTRHEVDLTQRYPMPFRDDVLRVAKEVNVDPAYLMASYGKSLGLWSMPAPTWVPQVSCR